MNLHDVIEKVLILNFLLAVIVAFDVFVAIPSFLGGLAAFLGFFTYGLVMLLAADWVGRKMKVFLQPCSPREIEFCPIDGSEVGANAVQCSNCGFDLKTYREKIKPCSDAQFRREKLKRAWGIVRYLRRAGVVLVLAGIPSALLPFLFREQVGSQYPWVWFVLGFGLFLDALGFVSLGRSVFLRRELETKNGFNA